MVAAQIKMPTAFVHKNIIPFADVMAKRMEIHVKQNVQKSNPLLPESANS